MRVFAAVLCLFLALPSVLAQKADTLDIWVIDVEGGKALIVKNPSGETMMIDGGMPDMAGRGGAPGMPGRGGAQVAHRAGRRRESEPLAEHRVARRARLRGPRCRPRRTAI